MTQLSHLHLLEPWELIQEYSENFETELASELSPSHPLFGKTAIAVARRRDSDDVLFELNDTVPSFAVVHLAWSGERETGSFFPETVFFDSYDDWLTACEKDISSC